MTLRIISTVWAPASATAPAAPYDLTSLANAHDEFEIPATDVSKDPRLSRFIAEASAAINSYCNRVFAVEGLTDLFYADRASLPPPVPGGAAPLQLTRWPLANLVTLPTSADTPSGAVLPFTGTTGVIDGAPVSGGGSANLAALETGATIPAATTVASHVANVSATLSQTLLGDLPAGSPVTFGLSVWQLLADGTLRGLVRDSDYMVDVNTGELFRLDARGRLRSWEIVPTSVAYYAGYKTVPPDVEDACLRLVTNRWFSRGRDPTLREQEMPNRGRQVWWVGGPPKSGALPDEIVGLIEKYRVPVAL